ncbi:MAG: hypothetical protein RLZZ306_3476 [Bacteroidota bacterium]|jgi:hypothetical protein
MSKEISFLGLLFVLLLTKNITAQNTRISDENVIGWYTYTGTFNLNKKVGIHTEFQWRRENMISDAQQNLLRLGVNYQLLPNTQLRVGYALVETFPYGDIPLNGMGRDFTEHRTFQTVTINNKLSKVDYSSRFMLEQRWVGRYSNINVPTEDDFPLLNRLRYMARFQIPLKGKSIEDKTPYLAVYDEIFVGFGKNVNENIFDQNRLGVLLGYRFNKNFRLEAGYLNQILQLGREVEGRNVFQYNNGLIVNSVFNFTKE